jgi:WS/DGAT/MGAT family acyltransferase
VAAGLRSSTGSIARQGGTELTGPVGPHRVVAWAAAPLEEIKTIRAALGGTVNDVVLGVVTNGFRELLRSRGEDVEGREVRTLVPVSVRTTRADGAATGDGTFDNKVSAMVAALPVGIDDPVERHHSLVAKLGDLKESNQALAGKALTDVSAHTPALLHALGARVVARTISTGPTPIQTVTTNIPGPQLPLFCCGRKLVHLYPYVPVAAPVRVSVSIFSYNGEVTFSVTGDRDVSADVDVLARGITHGIAELVEAAAQTTKPAIKDPSS